MPKCSNGALGVRVQGAQLAWYDDFVASHVVARMLDELPYAFWSPSLVVHRSGNGTLSDVPSRTRVSQSTDERWFSGPLLRDLRRVEARIARLVGCPIGRFEPWQATRYRPGGLFSPHLDGGYWRSSPAGDREKTVLIHLRAPKSGGSTRFTLLEIDVPCRPGRLLLWDNLMASGKPDPLMLHAGMPVRRGSKVVLVTWIRQRSIRDAGSGGTHEGRSESRETNHQAVRPGHRPAGAAGDHDRHPQELRK
jgi:hypothetical protein